MVWLKFTKLAAKGTPGIKGYFYIGVYAPPPHTHTHMDEPCIVSIVICITMAVVLFRAFGIDCFYRAVWFPM